MTLRICSPARGGCKIPPVMRLHLPAAVLAVVVTVLVAPLDSRAQSTLTNGAWNTTISPAEGGTKSLISFSASGDWATDGYNFPFNSPAGGFFRQQIAFTGISGAASNAWNLTDFQTSLFVAPFGYFTNHTQGISQALEELYFETPSPGQGVLAVGSTNLFAAAQGDWVQIVFSNTPTELLMDLPFTNFNQGTYNGVDSRNTQYNLEIVPEPSTYALLALSAAGLGGYVLRRRRK
jgi:hypothetical protein